MSSTNTTPEQRLAAIARRQHGVWSRRQAMACGFTDKMIRTRIRRGEWLRVDTAVYTNAMSLPTWERSVMAAVLAEPRAVPSHRTAAVLHGLLGFRPGRPEITVPPGANARGALALVHRGVDVPTTRAGAFRITNIAHTFIDLAQTVSTARLGAAFADEVRRSPRSLEAVRDRYSQLAPRGGRNLASLKAVLLRHGTEPPCSESELEVRLHDALDDPRIPEVHWQAPFPGRQDGTERVDGLITAWAIVVEGDGRAWHTRVDDFERDRRRDAEAAAHGLLTLRFTWNQITNETAWLRRTLIAAGCCRAVA
jgi:very-short-patch-repair endonuclease